MALAGVSACTRQPAGGHRSLRDAARRARSGEAALFRDGDAVCRLRRRSSGREPRRAADQDRGQPGSPVEPWRHRPLCAGVDPGSVRSRPLAGAHPSRRDSSVRSVCGGDSPGCWTPSRDHRAAASASSVKPCRRRRSPPRSTSSCARFPRAKWVQWEPFGRHNVREGSRLAFGEYVDAKYSLEKADVILSLDSDFLVTGNGALAHARSVCVAPHARERPARSAIACTRSRARRPTRERRPTIDFCFVPPTLARLPRAVAAQLGVAAASGGSAPESSQSWLGPLVKDLQNAKGRSLVIAGEGQPPAVHALAHAMNDVLGNVGNTVVYTPTVEPRPMDQRAGARRAGRRNERRHGQPAARFSAEIRSTRRPRI